MKPLNELDKGGYIDLVDEMKISGNKKYDVVFQDGDYYIIEVYYDAKKGQYDAFDKARKKAISIRQKQDKNLTTEVRFAYHHVPELSKNIKETCNYKGSF